MSNNTRTECILQWPMSIGNATFLAGIQFAESTNNKNSFNKVTMMRQFHKDTFHETIS